MVALIFVLHPDMKKVADASMQRRIFRIIVLFPFPSGVTITQLAFRIHECFIDSDLLSASRKLFSSKHLALHTDVATIDVDQRGIHR
jgi:hypothetical protein